jgi:hypothetical protein
VRSLRDNFNPGSCIECPVIRCDDDNDDDDDDAEDDGNNHRTATGAIRNLQYKQTDVLRHTSK